MTPPVSPAVRRNTWLLAAGHGLLSGQLPVHMILGGLAGTMLAGQPEYGTLPITSMVLGTMCVTAPLSIFMQRFGRRSGFLLGACSGALGGMVCAYAIFVESFAILIAGSFLIGGYQAANGYFRFAATDIGPPEFRPKAVSLVLAGGLLGAIYGPEIVRQTRSLLDPVPFAGAYLFLIPINLVGILPVLFLNLPKPATPTQSKPERPLLEVLSSPGIPAAMICAILSYSVMTLVMTATPLAMIMAGCSTDQAADVVRWHVVAMFFPSFFTGSLIVRFGHVRVIMAGLLLLAGAGLTAMTGTELRLFYAALVLLGVGWNFGFIGATSLLAASHAPRDRARVQGTNDLLLFGSLAVASLSSGALLSLGGWSLVQYAIAPAILVAAFSLFLMTKRAHPGRWSNL